jgi:hypothetical protein
MPANSENCHWKLRGLEAVEIIMGLVTNNDYL